MPKGAFGNNFRGYMLEIYLGNNKVWPFFPSNSEKKHCFHGFDMELELNPKLRTQVFLGVNGSGKSFIGKMVTYMAYLYHQSNLPEDFRDWNVDAIIKCLHEAGFGTFIDNRSERRLDRIYLKTYLNPDVKKPRDDDSNTETYMRDTYYCLNLGPRAKWLFEHHPIVFYSNSQFPSNETFHTIQSSSLVANDPDIIFWRLYKGVNPELEIAVHFWYNKTATMFEASDTPDFARAFQDAKYKNQHVFNHLPFKIESHSFIFDTKVYRYFESFLQSKNKFPDVLVDVREMEIKDYLCLLILKESRRGFSFDFNVDGTSFRLLNSGKRYLYALNCILEMSGHSIVFIDEPENALHLNIQKKIGEYHGYAKDTPNLILLSHSPAFIMGVAENATIYAMDLDEKKLSHLPPTGSISLDDISADFFGFAPYLQTQASSSAHRYLNESNMISIEDFYKRLQELQ